ncbi:MAG: hypothetical protein LAT76_09030 [Schleiferiaceae bacterium]|nr:hypothetical protein [Schleiferiaceae bacterium]
MKMKFLLFPFAFLLWLSACKKEEEIESTWIQVVEYGTHKPIPDVRIEIQVWTGNEGYFGFPKTVGEIFTDHNGKALIQNTFNTFTYKQIASIRIYTDGRPYFDADVDFALAEYWDFRDKPLIEVYPIAYVRLQADWSVFEGEFDYVRNSPVPGCTPNDCMFTFNASTTLPTPPLRVYGNRIENKVVLSGYKAGQPTIFYFSEEVYSPAFDTTTYILRR